MKTRKYISHRFIRYLCSFAIVLFCTPNLFADQQTGNLARYRVFSLKHISAEQGKKFLEDARIGTVSQLPGTNALLVTASQHDLLKATAILKLIDSGRQFTIKAITPVSKLRQFPSNQQIQSLIGDISIGTFTDPPTDTEENPVVIDTHEDSVIAIAPAEKIERILFVAKQLQKARAESLKLAEPNTVTEPALTDINEPKTDEFFTGLMKSLAEAEELATELGMEIEPPAAEQLTKQKLPKPVAAEDKQIVEKPLPEPQLEQEITELEEPTEVAIQTIKSRSYEPEAVAIGNEMLDLDLPEKLNIVDLLGLVGEYLDLDYMFDPAKVKGDVTLRLRGPIKVKDLYPLLESVLKFRGFVMARKGNLVTIVPQAEALDIDPTLLDAEKGRVKLGDVIVTRIFQLNYIDTASAKNLLDGMKLGANITPIPDTATIIVTGYAYRMERVEELLTMVDKPGAPKQFRFRQLKYTMAKNLAPKIKTLAEQLGTVSVSISAPAKAPARRTPRRQAAKPKTRAPSPTTAKPTVYLDADERTNRILMIGFEEQLAVVDELIDTLDVQQQDLRDLRIYDIVHVDAEEVRNKLSELGIIGAAGATPTTTRARAEKPKSPQLAAGRITETLSEEPQVVIIESTNSLLVNASPEQHIQIATIISFVDAETLEQAIPYEIYGLENQSPEDLAGVLNDLIQETIKDKEGKIERVVKKEEDIVIVPDENTFSLIVYASRKNQEWIRKLITSLDKRRPQVLIDVTLVEISRDDEFEYDLDLVTKFPHLTPGGNMDLLPAILGSTSSAETAVSLPSKRITEASTSLTTGTGKGFYADTHIQALLTLMQTKDYGRVLAKPKILVNDNETGAITTVDKRFIAEETTRFTEENKATTSKEFKEFDAKIELEITPHISEGNLLRLEVNMTREDFLATASSEGAPPNQATSQVNTTVTVPDQRTIILGGLIKLTQSKGGGKVPLLGDLPIVGALFRNIDNSDVEKKLYVFVKAHILRPDKDIIGLPELEAISARNREAFERAEDKFQKYENFPGFDPDPMDPLKVLDEI